MSSTSSAARGVVWVSISLVTLAVVATGCDGGADADPLAAVVGGGDGGDRVLRGRPRGILAKH